MITRNFKLLIALLIILISSAQAAVQFDYPELMVSPRATERLLLEAKQEKSFDMLLHLPLQISATNTLLAGALMMGDVDEDKDPDKKSPLAGLIIGGGWLGLSLAMNMYYKPYRRAYAQIAKMPVANKKQELMRERLAEEAIDAAARVGRRMAWISFLTNVAANGYMMGQAKSKSNGQFASALGLLTSFAPLIFQYHWIEVSNNQKEYKKKIYSPIALNTILYDKANDQLAPGLGLTFAF